MPPRVNAPSIKPCGHRIGAFDPAWRADGVKGGSAAERAREPLDAGEPKGDGRVARIRVTTDLTNHAP